MSTKSGDRPVDVTGTMAKGTPGWEQRTEELAKPELWAIALIPSTDLWAKLSPDEQTRLSKKVKMVQEAVGWMLAGMVKGTVKYTSDDWSVDRWMAHLIGEGADQMNYQILLFNSYHENKRKGADKDHE